MKALFVRIFNSIKFRYNYYIIVEKQTKLNRLKARHDVRVNNIKANDFTIISSNCWGGSIYEDLKLQYQSPTIGLYFFAPDFIAFVKNLKKNIDADLSFIKQSRYPEANDFIAEKHFYPIGLLNNSIEIQFLHYTSEEEAKEKWNRRKQRINWDKLFIACTDRDGMTPELMKEYDQLPYIKKVLFTAKKYSNIKSAVSLKAYKYNSVVGDLYNERYHVTPDFNLQKWLWT